VVVTGGDRVFAAGADISEFGGPEEAKRIGGQFLRSLNAVADIPRATIAAVSGVALGGGCELALACDFIYASEQAKFGQPEVKLGVIPGFGGTQRLARRVGVAKAKELCMTGDMIDAAEALRIGLVNRVVSVDQLAAEVDALADRLARVPPDVMAPTKLMLNRAMEAAGFLEAVAAGLDLQSFVNMSETSREFDAVVRRDGLKAALAWRDQRYDERLAESGRSREDASQPD